MDLNLASKQDIVALKGIGETLAKRIVKARPFARLEDLLSVKGVSPHHLDLLREQGVIVNPKAPKPLIVKLVGKLEAETEALVDEPLKAYVFNAEDKFLAMGDLKEGERLKLSERELGQAVTLFAGPQLESTEEAPRADRFRRGGYVEGRFTIPQNKPHINFGKWILPPHWRKKSCCRVRGKVLKRIVMPNGETRTAPLCNARVEICEVDKSPRRVIEKLPSDLLARLKIELIELGTPPTPPIDPPPLEVQNIAGTQRARELRTFAPNHELAELATALKATTGIEAARATIQNYVAVLKPTWCYLEWLFNDFHVECLKTVLLDSKGCFDTDIVYPCYGDKPDLYFRVEQKCHAGGWTRVHAPTVSCNTHWNYCCGDVVEIIVTNPEAATGLTPGGCHFPYSAEDPASVGEWAPLPDSEVFVVHAAVMYTGKVLLFSGGTESQLPLESRVWDPQTGNVTAQNFADDLFCAHQISLADGRILVMGGSNYNGPHGRGIDASYTFDPVSEVWTKHPDMNHGRWYPTAVLLPNGKALTFSGRLANGPIATKVEIFDPATNVWSQLPASADKELEIYPTMHLMKDGRIFYTGCRWAGGNRNWPAPPDTALFAPSTNSWSDVGPHVIPNRTEGTSILLPPAKAMSMEGHEHGEELPPPPSNQKVLVVGGVADSEANRVSAEIIDMNETNPTWARIADMHFRRVNPNAVILPDRKVMIFGGVEKYKFDWDPGNVLTCELFDPTSETWTPGADMANPRQYHSIGVLLPDGRVLATGTTSSYGNDQTMEVYSPPYLFRGPRPRITGYPASAKYGTTIEVESPDACRIVDACLVRPAAPTHHTDSEQRLVPLHIMAQGDCFLKLMIPKNPGILPPGYYMLFILDDCEIPSVARFVHVS